MSQLTIEKITDTASLAALEPVWNGLLSRSQSNTIALTWGWLTTWWEVFQEGRELFVLVVRDGAAVVGLAPLLKHNVQQLGLSYRRLEFLASGEEEADEICSEYLDFILLAGQEAEILEEIFNYLNTQETGWDEMALHDLPESSPNLPLLQELCPAQGIQLDTGEREESLYVPFTADWQTLAAGLSRSFRQKINRERRYLLDNGGEFKVIDTLEAFDATFETLIRLHQARWGARGEAGVFSSEKFTRFHRLLAPKLLKQGWLKLFAVQMNGEPISVIYTFVYDYKVYFYQSGFIEVTERTFSPTIINLSYSMEHCMAAGLKEWDFLKGASDYKARWGSQERYVVQLRLTPPRSKGLLIKTTTKCLESLRHVKRSLMR